MITFKVSDGDLVFDGQGTLVMVEAVNEEKQAIERVLTTSAGEWFLNILHGLDYEKILTKPFSENRARLALVEAVTQDPRVDRVEKMEFRFDRARRSMEIETVVKMRSGNVVQEVIPIG